MSYRVEAILRKYGVRVVENNKENPFIYCICPLHERKDPSKTKQNFSIHRHKGFWTCWSKCGKGGLRDLVVRLEGCLQSDAQQILRDKAYNRSSIKDLANDIIARVKRRKLTVRRWPESFEPIPCNHPWIAKRRYKPEDFERFNVAYDRDQLHYVFFPVVFKGRLRGFTARDIRRAPKRKWNHDKDLQRNLLLYNYDRALYSDIVIIAEGPLDVIRLHTFGYNCAIATFGTQVGHEQIELLKNTWSKIIIAFDNDDGGNDGCDRLVKRLERDVEFLGSLQLPDGKDVDDLETKTEFVETYRKMTIHVNRLEARATLAGLRKAWSQRCDQA